MKNHPSVCLFRAWILVLLGVVAGRGEDFLFVVAVPIGRLPELHWVPANAPLSAQVLVEELRGVSDVERFGNELWWWPQERVNVVKADLVGETTRVSYADLRETSALLREGDVLYEGSFNGIESVDLRTGATKELVVGNDRVTALALYEDRLYFTGRSGLESIRVNGTGRRTEVTGSTLGGLFGRSQVIDIAIHRNQLFWIKEKELWQMNLKTQEKSLLDGALIERPLAFTVSSTAIYWIGDRKIWRRAHADGVDELFYELGDTSFLSLSVVSAEPYPATINKKGDILVQGPPEGTYQLLHSEDLREWSPVMFAKTLFSEHGKLDFLNPLIVNDVDVSELSWFPRPLGRESYFSVWKYDLDPGLDSDGDGIADYWERDFFGSLIQTGAGDFDGDGLSNFEEFEILANPTLADTDKDALPDFDEARGVYDSSPSLNDTDSDGLDDGLEVLTLGTDPRLADTDGDRFSDGFEIENGSNPKQSESVPPRDSEVNVFAESLMVHFEFDAFEEGLVSNAGSLGGNTEVVGDASFVDPEETRTMTGALRFGESGFIETEIGLRDLGFNPSSPEFTIAFWVRPLVRQTAPLASFSPSPNSEEGFHLSMSNSGSSQFGDSLNLSIVGMNGSQGLSVGGRLESNVWTHVVWAFDSRSKLYVNGELLSDLSSVGMTILDTAMLSIGAPARSRGSFEGDLDDFRVYKRAVSADVVALLAQ